MHVCLEGLPSGGSAAGTQVLFQQIFTEDLPEVEALPRDRVLGFLVENFKGLAVPYLVRYFLI